jgi:hypothetical protein
MFALRSSRQIATCLIRRWSMETTFQELRLYLGVEGQRQWNALAVRIPTLQVTSFVLTTREPRTSRTLPLPRITSTAWRRDLG